MASSLPDYRRFRSALVEPQVAQQLKLRNLLKQNEDTAFGKAHGFHKIDSYDAYARRVPLSDYNTLEPWLARVRQGEEKVLTRERITHLVPTSGSTGARKLIPFTAGLQREFNVAIGAWLVDLIRQAPTLLGGPAYWSITPVIGHEVIEELAVPIGFDSDTAYLGGGRRKLVEAVMAVPIGVGHAKTLEAFRYETLLHLLLCADLRLISVWHPSFLTLLLDSLPGFWEHLIADVEHGTAATPANPRRADQLRVADPGQAESLWPRLRVISCWGDGAASLALEQLRRRFPEVLLQPKGLLATEAFVTLPFEGQFPIAVNSHFFEFVDENGLVCPVETLRSNQEYEVALTTAGGLWRYRLGDLVRVTGWVKGTPSLVFIGRNGNVSDHFGEKLSEAFVTDSLTELFENHSPAFALLAPDKQREGTHYTLYVEGNAPPHWAESLDRSLRRNPHYAYCRNLGQLLPVRVFSITERGYETFAARQAAKGTRLGDIKPAVLSNSSGWSEIFSGSYTAEGEYLSAHASLPQATPISPSTA